MHTEFTYLAQQGSYPLPYYLYSVEARKAKTTIAIRACGKKIPNVTSRPKDTPWVYVPLTFFDNCSNDNQRINLILHRLRYYTRKIEGYYDFNELVVYCRPFRDQYKTILSELSHEWYNKYPNYKYDPFLVSKLKYAIRNRIPNFPVF